MPNTLALTESAQDYLEALLLASEDRSVVRISDVARRLGVRLPSVVAMLKGLAAKGLVKHERYGLVELTEAGRAEARAVLARHKAIFRFLNGFLGVSEATAEIDACRIEHVLSPDTVKRLLKLVTLLEREGAAGKAGLHDFPRLAGGRRTSACGKRAKS
ncbi:MAG TPA: metal-dependent transcriptional regulator [bacterium]|nr:metal-dependent transcriptional regulator [bacterium]